MSTDLHEQLAAELGVSPSEAEQALDDLLDDVRERTRSGDEVVLQGLGTFYLDEGTLQFTPTPQLQKAVNYRNDHLAPLTIREPSETAPPSPEDEPAAPEEEAAGEPPAPEEAPAPFPEDEAAVAETASDEPENVASLSDDWTEEIEAEDARDVSPENDDGEESAVPSTGQVAGLVAAVVLLVFLVWFVLGSQGIVTGPGALFQSASSPPPMGTDTVATTTPPTDTTAAGPSTADAADTAGAERQPQPDPPPIDRATGGWTIVVASRTSPTEAKRTLEAYQQQFQGEGLPVDILTGTSGNQTRYRISIGQYDSRAAALNALQQLQGRVPDDAWPLQVRPDS